MNKKGNSKPRQQNTNRGNTVGEAADVLNQINGDYRGSGNNQNANSRRGFNNSNRDKRNQFTRTQSGGNRSGKGNGSGNNRKSVRNFGVLK